MQLNETHRTELRSWVESANAPESEVRKLLRRPPIRTSESKEH
jgi:hypothetical protein